jgi:NAD-dependent SIR2 family protein deacetylase
MDAHETRQRYWARSAVGWPRFKQAQPNDAHEAISRLEEAGIARGVITQNVDRLHHKAGSQRVVELHGALAEVRCMQCDHIFDRDDMQRELRSRNPDWVTEARALHPDGDAELPEEVPDDYDIPACPKCDGILKPDVVFFGENVRSDVVNRAWRLMGRSDAILVVGSSLTVYSGYRFVRRARERRKPVAIINLGETRADEDAWVKVEAQAGPATSRLVERLC